jgi:oxalate decarboxylase
MPSRRRGFASKVETRCTILVNFPGSEFTTKGAPISFLSRRRFLETASAAAAAGAAAGGVEAAAGELAQKRQEYKQQGDELPTLRYALEEHPRGRKTAGGSARQATVKELPISRGLAGVSVRLNPGEIRELHWRPNMDEWQYYISGRARMTVFGSNGRARTEEFKPGDVGYAPRGYGHYIENLRDEPLRVLIGYNSGEYQEISLSTWLAANPDAVIAGNFKVADSIVAKLPKERVFIASKDGPAV